jgi:hypothetical protein
MIGRADIEGSKSNVAMNAWLPQASYHEGATAEWTSPAWSQGFAVAVAPSFEKGVTFLTPGFRKKEAFRNTIQKYFQKKIRNLRVLKPFIEIGFEKFFINSFGNVKF